MASPSRFTSGLTQAASYQPLGHLGLPDPFFYASFEDDFLPYNAAKYTVTAASGSVAMTATDGSGGRILLTTGATAASFAELQLPAASFQYTVGKKLAYLCRLKVASVTTSAFIAGLIGTNVTPFTAVADGIYFNKVAGSTNLVLTVMTGSVVIGSYTFVGALVNNTDIDLGFVVDRLGNVKIFVGNNLEGFKRANTANLGPNATISNKNLTGVITSVMLNPTLALSNGATAAAMTGISDFLFSAQER